MLGRTVGALATLSLGANAFLLPPGATKSSDSPDDAMAFAIDPKSQAIKVHCSTCVFPAAPQQESVQEKGDDDIVWVQGGSNDVLFNFTVADNDKHLLLNGVKVYPVDLFTLDDPTVGQVHSSASMADIKNNPAQITPLRVSSAGMHVHKDIVSSLDDQLVNINYQISELESQSMTIDAVELKLLETSDGSLMIISLDAVPTKHMSDVIAPSTPAIKDCRMLPASLCKWKSLVEDKISSLKPPMPHCGGRRPPHRLPTHIRPHFDNPINGDARPDHPHAPPHRGPHHPHPPHRHHGHHHMFPAFLRAAVAVLIPVFAGITMGMFVSLIGMMLGRLISFLWIKFGRRGQRGYASVAQSDQDTESAEKGLVVVEDIVDDEALPKYEDAPAYDEKDHK
jgi:hypothetical protein